MGKLRFHEDRQRGQQGMALVEFALTATMLLTIVFGITEFGRAIYQYDTLAKSARDAARHLSTRSAGDADAVAAAGCLAVFGKPTCTDSSTPLAPGLTTAMVSVCDSVSCPGTHQAVGSAPAMNLVTVTIGGAGNPYHFTSLVEFVVPGFDFGPISVTMRQAL
jgi:Flp pilus assembly protein TadG